MKNALGMKSTGFKLWKIAAVAGAFMALAAFGGTTAAFAQSVPASEGCQGPEMPRFDDCQRLEGSWLYTVTIPNPSGAPIVFQGVETYAAGGGYSEADQLSFTPGYLATRRTRRLEADRGANVPAHLHEPHLRRRRQRYRHIQGPPDYEIGPSREDV